MKALDLLRAFTALIAGATSTRFRREPKLILDIPEGPERLKELSESWKTDNIGGVLVNSLALSQFIFSKAEAGWLVEIANREIICTKEGEQVVEPLSHFFPVLK